MIDRLDLPGAVGLGSGVIGREPTSTTESTATKIGQDINSGRVNPFEVYTLGSNPEADLDVPITESEIMARIIRDIVKDIPNLRIMEDKESHSTFENMANLYKLFLDNQPDFGQYFVYGSHLHSIRARIIGNIAYEDYGVRFRDLSTGGEGLAENAKEAVLIALARVCLINTEGNPSERLLTAQDRYRRVIKLPRSVYMRMLKDERYQGDVINMLDQNPAMLEEAS